MTAEPATLPPRRHGFARRLFDRLGRGRPVGIGALLFVFHRLTGVGLTLYLFVHLVTLGSVLEGPEGFDRVMASMSTLAFRILELGLVMAVLFHLLNGLRLTVLALGSNFHPRALGYAVIALTIVGALASLPFFL